ncbi:MAG: membrane protein insertase YidC [Bacteroidota bacterium]
MDKRNILGFIMIFVVVVAWMFYSSVNEKPQIENPNQKNKTSSTISEDVKPVVQDTTAVADEEKNDTLLKEDKYGKYFSNLSEGKEDFIRIENDFTKFYISSKGAAITRWELKHYKMWNGYPTELIAADKGNFFITFITIDNKKIDTRDLYFQFDTKGQNNFKLSGKDSLVITAILPVGETGGKFIKKQFVFYGNRYTFRANVEVSNFENIIPSRGVNLVWSDGLRYQEQNSVDESGDAVAMGLVNGSDEELNAEDTPTEKSITGRIDYIAVKTKYFGVAIIPDPKTFDGTADFSAYKKHTANSGFVEKYTANFRLPYKGGSQSQSFLVYIGPLEYDRLNELGLAAMVNFGWRWVIRPIGEYFMMPIFKFIHKFIANYGISLIIFSILMKLLLYPFSIQQLKSSQKMQLLGPEMQKLRDKYKDDQQTQQKETMKLYSEYGINPAGGCLPLLLQMPILYALWSVLRTAIDLRQANFFLWITDLSVPDNLIALPFSFLGITHLSGLALLMGITMFFQQKLTLTDPRQKAMIYMMPVMFTLLFSNFPSGLNLYYFMFNLMSIGQQVYINKYSRKRLTLEDLKRMPKKEGWIQKKMREAQNLAGSQGKSLPFKQQINQQNQNANKNKKPGRKK